MQPPALPRTRTTHQGEKASADVTSRHRGTPVAPPENGGRGELLCNSTSGGQLPTQPLRAQGSSDAVTDTHTDAVGQAHHSQAQRCELPVLPATAWPLLQTRKPRLSGSSESCLGSELATPRRAARRSTCLASSGEQPSRHWEQPRAKNTAPQGPLLPLFTPPHSSLLLTPPSSSLLSPPPPHSSLLLTPQARAQKPP